MISVLFLLNVTDFPTMSENESGSAINSNFIDGSRINLLTVASFSNGLSDHEVQFLVLEKVVINSEISLTYRVIQEESAILWEMIVCVILSKKVHMNMGLILNGYGVMTA